MKNSILFAAMLGLTLGFNACSDDDIVKGGSNSRSEGDVIKFGVDVRDSRTTYGTGDGEDNWNIYWNYGTDKVRMFCNQTGQKNYDYVVAKSYKGTYDSARNYTGTGTYEETGTGTSGVLKESSEDGALKWSTGIGKAGLHHFYGVYPASTTYNVTCTKYVEEKDESDYSYGSEHAIFKCPFKTDQTVKVASDLTATPDMEAQYMFSSLDNCRKTADNYTMKEFSNFTFNPVMTTLDVVITRSNEDSGSDTPLIFGVDVEATLPTSVANDGAFYYYLSSNGGDLKGLCNADGTLYSKWTDDAKNATTTKTFHVSISGGNLDEGTGDGVTLEKGQSITLTVFLPPLDYSNVKFTVLGTNTGSVGAVSLKSTLPMSQKKKTAVNITNSDATDWITPLDDNIYVQQLSIPGSNECASYLASSKVTQSKTIVEQLNMGIRAFDTHTVREYAWVMGARIPVVGSTSFDLYSNGSLGSKKMYGYDNTTHHQGTTQYDATLQVLLAETIAKWLDDHKGEFVILFVTEDLSWSNFDERLKKSLKDSGKLVTWNRHLTIGDCRGKVIVMTRYGGDKSNIGSDATRFDDNFNRCDTSHDYRSLDAAEDAMGILYYYARNSGDVYNETNRIAAIKKLWELAGTDPETIDAPESKVTKNYDHPWFMTYIAGSSNGNDNTEGYCKNAAAMHPVFYDYIKKQSTPKPLGIIFMDYVGVQKSQYFNDTRYTIDGKTLPAAIIMNNYKADLKKAKASCDSETHTN